MGRAAADSDGIAAIYAGLIDGLSPTSAPRALPVLETDVLMDGRRAAPALAEETLQFALRSRPRASG